MLRVRGLRAQLHGGGCQVPALLSSLRPGHSGRRRQSVNMPQTLPRRPENASGPPQAASLSTSLSTGIPFPGPASRTWVQLDQPLPLTAPVPLSSRKSEPASPGAQDACATVPAAPPCGPAAGASRWAPGPRALPGCGARLCGIASPAGLRGFRARDSAGCEGAPGEALKEEVVDLGTPGPP